MAGDNSEKKSNVLVKLMTIVQVLGWSLILMLNVLLIYYEFTGTPLKLLRVCIITNVKIFQTLQVFEILFSILGWSGGSVLSSMLQIIGRLVIAFFYLDIQMSSDIYWNILFCWGSAEVIRNMFYLTKSRIVGALRYNCFLFLYPIGVAGELRALEFNLSKNRERGNQYLIMIRTIQISIVVGLSFLYSYMLKQRKKYYQAEKVKAN
jgi:hypothetical protein